MVRGHRSAGGILELLALFLGTPRFDVGAFPAVDFLRAAGAISRHFDRGGEITRLEVAVDGGLADFCQFANLFDAYQICHNILHC